MPPVDYSARMPSILDQSQGIPTRHYDRARSSPNRAPTEGALFLVEGAVEVIKDGVRIVVARERARSFGEMSAFLQAPPRRHRTRPRALRFPRRG